MSWVLTPDHDSLVVLRLEGAKPIGFSIPEARQLAFTLLHQAELLDQRIEQNRKRRLVQNDNWRRLRKGNTK